MVTSLITLDKNSIVLLEAEGKSSSWSSSMENPVKPSKTLIDMEKHKNKCGKIPQNPVNQPAPWNLWSFS